MSAYTDSNERHYFLITCSKHGTATVAAYEKMISSCPKCDWERSKGKKRGKLNIVEITQEQYDWIEARHQNNGETHYGLSSQP